MADPKSQWWTRRSVAAHATLTVLLVAFSALFVWQLHRALSGNWLSWMYVFEWPIFALYAAFLWWKLVHDTPTATTGRGAGAPSATGTGTPDVNDQPAGHGDASPPADGEDADEDEELAAYNRYLAALNASGRTKRW